MRNLIAFSFLCVLALTAGAQVSQEKELYKPVGECPPVDGDKPVYLPDEEDMTIFYECNRGKPWLLRCPPKTIFDPKLSVCVHSSNTTSSTSAPNTTSSTSAPDTTRFTTTSGPSNITTSTSTPSPTSSTNSPTTTEFLH